MEPYHSWPVSDFGPDELLDVQDALVKYKYVQGKKKKRYTRGSINDVIKWIRKIWKWGMGRQFITAEQVQGLEEVKPLRMGDTEAPDSNLAASYSQEMAYYSLRHFWRWKSHRKGGRPQISKEMQNMIYRLSKENPLWSPERIRDTLVLLQYNPPCDDIVADQ